MSGKTLSVKAVIKDGDEILNAWGILDDLPEDESEWAAFVTAKASELPDIAARFGYAPFAESATV